MKERNGESVQPVYKHISKSNHFLKPVLVSDQPGLYHRGKLIILNQITPLLTVQLRVSTKKSFEGAFLSRHQQPIKKNNFKDSMLIFAYSKDHGQGALSSIYSLSTKKPDVDPLFLSYLLATQHQPQRPMKTFPQAS